MAEVARLVVSVKDLEPMKLLVWELRMLADRMRVEASPHAEALERLVDRFTDGNSSDDRPDSDKEDR